MAIRITLLPMAFTAVIGLVAAQAGAQSDPAAFGTVYNIGMVPPGSIFDVPGAIVGNAAPSVIDSDTQLNLFNGGAIPAPFRAGSVTGLSSNMEINIFGGMVGQGFRVWTGGAVNIHGGVVGGNILAEPGSVFNITGGAFADFFDADQSTINISGGTVGAFLRAEPSTVVNISGGGIGSELRAFQQSTVNISGGAFGRPFRTLPDSTVNLYGTSFFLDGVEIAGLVPGQPFTITARGNALRLTGTFVDGTPIDFILNSADLGVVTRGVDLFDDDATLTVTLVPGRADFNFDGTIDASDLADFAAAATERNARAHVDGTPGVDVFDAIEFVSLHNAATN